jgi:hypothetical protein
VVADYYSTHGTTALWQASLFGFAVICFLWFAGVFSEATTVLGPVVLASASVTAALYLVAIGAWESLGEIYRASSTDLDDGDAHALYDVGVGSTHLANFSVAAFVGATAFAVLATGQHVLGLLGVVLAGVQLVNAPFQIAATSHWSDVVGFVVFICFLAWVFATSVWLFRVIRRAPANAPAGRRAG